MCWNSKLLFADRISALSRVDFSGKYFKGGIDCAASAWMRELGVISVAGREGRRGQLGTNLGIDGGSEGGEDSPRQCLIQ